MAPIKYLTESERKRYRQIKTRVKELDRTWRRIGGDGLLRELSLATLEMQRLESLAYERKEAKR